MGRFATTIGIAVTLAGIPALANTAVASAALDGSRARDPRDARDPASTRARAVEAAAARAYAAAVASGDRATIGRARAALAAARARRAALADARRADPADAPAVANAALASALADDEALVVFATSDDDALSADVHTRAAASTVPLGSVAAVAALLDALDLEDAALDPTATLAALRARLVEPLALPSAVARVHVVVPPALAGVAFVALDPSRSWTRSASTAAWLAARRAPSRAPGAGVLAIGDPTGGATSALAADAGDDRDVAGAWRPSLPGAAAEARAVGDVVLLHAQATEPALRAALASRARWGALVLAGHGVAPAGQPADAGFLLAPSADDDGLWTASDVREGRPAADVVVLAACDLGRADAGRASSAYVGAWLASGARAVVACRWKADDAATTRLVTTLVAGLRAGLDPARALAAAQAGVRAVPAWSHPRYWAGWTVDV